MKMINEYRIGESTTIFFNGEAEIIFRKGVWNFEEAILDISVFDEKLQDDMLSVFRELSEGNGIKMDDLFTKFNIDSSDIENVLSLLDELAEQDYLSNGSKENTRKLIASLIGGTASAGMGLSTSGAANTLLVCDSNPVIEQMLSMSGNISMNLAVLPKEEINRISKADLTGRLDALDCEKAYKELTQIFVTYSSVLICLQRPHIKLLRNLNRLLLRLDIPYVVCLIDGPFLSVMTIKGYETGCFECYETRVMARLEELASYKNFVEKSSGNFQKYDNTPLTPILSMVASLGLFEALLINTIHKAKLAGRVFNIYLPLLEVQVQDLLRIPFCSACGHIAKAQYDEMYTSSEKIVQNLIKNVGVDPKL